MSAQRQSAFGLRRLGAVAMAAAFVMLMVFTGTVLGHSTSNFVTFDCDGTVTYLIKDWTTDNTGNQALASDVQVAYSLDGGSYVSLPDGSFTLGNYVAGFGGSFDGSGATTVTIRANLAPATTWGDGDALDPGPWFSPTVTKPVCATYHPLTPARILDTRSGLGLTGKFVSHTAREITVGGQGGVDPAAVAVTGNLTVTDQTNAGYVSLTLDAESTPTTSTINFPVGDNRANGVTVPLNGSSDLWATYVASGTTASTDLLFDVTGYFTADATGATFHALVPARVLDTRFGTGLSGTFVSHHARQFAVAGRGGVDPAAIAVTGNLTVTGQTNAGFVALTLAADNAPSTSTLNFPLGDVRANGVTVPLNGSGDLWATYVAASSSATTNLVFDVTGYFDADASGVTYHPLTPARILDSRNDVGLIGPFLSKSPREFGVIGHGGVPLKTVAITGNLTVTLQTRAGYASLTTTAQSLPTTSDLNFPLGDIRANGVTAPLTSDGLMWGTYVGTPGAAASLILDVTGYFAP